MRFNIKYFLCNYLSYFIIIIGWVSVIEPLQNLIVLKIPCYNGQSESI